MQGARGRQGSRPPCPDGMLFACAVLRGQSSVCGPVRVIIRNRKTSSPVKT